MAPTSNKHLVTLVLVALVVVGLVFGLTSPIPQDPGYHLFADDRQLFTVPNCWDVLSNLPFLIAGLLGLFYVNKYGHDVCAPDLVPAYRVFFAGILLTAFGSGYYHLAPSNESLVFDRLPMTIGFAGLFSIVTGEFVSVRIGRRLLTPLLVIGVASVALIPIILSVYRSASDSTRYFWMMIAFYVLAKFCEFFDAEIFSFGEVVSGHTLKHLFASLTPATLLYALAQRRLS